MIQRNSFDSFRTELKNLGVMRAPSWHVVLGSGFGEAIDDLSTFAQGWRVKGDFAFAKVHGLSQSKVADHRGLFRVIEHVATSRNAIFQLGRIHGYEGHSPRTVAAPVMLSRVLGTKNFILTNAAGGIDPAHRPGDAMLIRDHINFTGLNPLVGENPLSLEGRELGPRFPDMTTTYDRAWREELRKHLLQKNLQVHEGVYLGLMGPSFETPAEVRLFATWGAHAVGMSTVWEAIALRHSGASLAALSLISNAAAGLGNDQALDHEMILLSCRKSARQIVSALLDFMSLRLADGAEDRES